MRWVPVQGRVAQLVEHLVYTQGVGGSIPSAPTNGTCLEDAGLADDLLDLLLIVQKLPTIAGRARKASAQ